MMKLEGHRGCTEGRENTGRKRRENEGRVGEREAMQRKVEKQRRGEKKEACV